MKRIHLILGALIWSLLLLFAYLGHADLLQAATQAATGDILGTVTDDSGAVIPGVTVTVANAKTGLSQTKITDGVGNYLFPFLPVGEYSVTAELGGFQTKIIKGIVLQTGQRARVDLKLSVGEIRQVVTVEGTAPLIKSDSMDLGIVVDNVKMSELPLNARSFVQLNALDVAASAHSGAGRGSFYDRFGGNYSFHGSPSDSNNFLLDGIDIRGQNDVRVGGRVSMDAIQEFKSETGLYSADRGRGAGAQVSVVTKSGTNEVHGTLFVFTRNDALDARNFFAPLNQKKPEFRQHQFGGTVGGPILRNKTYFFLSYEGWRIAKAVTKTYSVPPVEFRNGNFSGLNRVIYDPATAAPDPNNPGTFILKPFQGNTIPADRIDPTSKHVLDSLFPLPSVPGLGAGNLIASPIDTRDEDLYTFRVDHFFSEKDRFFGRYTGVFDHTITRVFAALPNFSDNFRVPSQSVSLTYTRTLSSAAVNEARIGYNRMTQFLQDVDFGKGILKGLGIQGTNPLFDYNPAINITGYNRTGAIGNAPNNRSENTYQIFDNLSYRLGTHTLGAGADVRRIQINGGIQASPTGSFSFESYYTKLPSDPLSGHAMADFLLGFPRSSVTSEGDGFRHHRTTHLGLYVKDDWNVRRNLTVNLGLRYEYFSPNVEKNNLIANFLPSVGELVIADRHAEFDLPRAMFRPDRNNFAPRVGFAYRPFEDNKTVLRAGYGVFYTPQTTIQTMVLGINPPALKQYSFVGNPVFPDLTIKNAFPENKKVLSTAANGQNPDYRIGYSQEYSLNVQRQLTQNLMFEISYVGNKGTKLRLQRNINLPVPGPGALAPRRRWPNFSGISVYDNFGNSIYHEMKLNVERRYSRGLGFLFSYSWSKLLDEGGLFSAGESGDALRRNPMDPVSERGLSIYDRRHRFAFSYVYQLPFGPGKALGGSAQGVAGWLIGGWQLSGITILQSGTPVDVYSAVDFANIGGGGRPDLVGDPNTGPKKPELWFNTRAFAQPPVYTYGTAGRNIVIGPGIINSDIALVKVTNFGDGRRLEFRAEFFNAFNEVNFNAPSGAYGTGDFGRIFAAADARQIQFGFHFFF